MENNIYKLNSNNINHCFSLISEEPIFSKYKNYNGWSKDTLKNFFMNKNSLSYGYFYSNELAALILSNYIKSEKTCEIEILLILVKKKYRRLGIGSALIKYLINQKKTEKLTNVYLELSHTNTIAKLFYEDYGFKNISMRKGYYVLQNQIKEDALLLNLVLNN